MNLRLQAGLGQKIMNKVFNNKKKGFTLIEVIIAISIISIISLALFRVINSAIKNNSKNEIDIHSLNVAQSEMEQLRSSIKENHNLEISINDSEKVLIINGENTVKYKKEIKRNDNKTIVYDINLNIIREEKNNLPLYTVKIVVANEENTFSSRNTVLKAQILGIKAD